MNAGLPPGLRDGDALHLLTFYVYSHIPESQFTFWSITRSILLRSGVNVLPSGLPDNSVHLVEPPIQS